MGEVFIAFLKLGLTSFGGPIAHIAYYRREFIERRRWIDDVQYTQLIALCQFLPGPSSSQVGFSIGLSRAGWPGALAAFLAFSLPSALILFAFAAALPYFSGTAGQGAIHGLKLVALVVVAHGVWGMARQLCPDMTTRVLAAVGAAVLIASGHHWMQLVVVVGGGLAGLLLCRRAKPVTGGALPLHYGTRLGWGLLAVFVVLLAALPLVAGATGYVALADAFYRAGSLVFGGGHVVLPLLEQTVVVPGWVDRDEFLAGYGAAQAVPGPIFAVSAYLGARADAATGEFAGAAVAFGAIFLPGFLLVAGALPLWRALIARPLAARAVAGINAAVVGLLAAALYDPIFTSAVRGWVDAAIAVVGLYLLGARRWPALAIVAWCVAAGVVVSLLPVR